MLRYCCCCRCDSGGGRYRGGGGVATDNFDKEKSKRNVLSNNDRD